MKHKLIAILQFITRPKLTGKHTGKTIILDNMEIRNAYLADCTLVYFGGQVTMTDTSCYKCKHVLSGKAGNTARLMKAFDGQELIAKTFPLTVANAICEDRKSLN